MRVIRKFNEQNETLKNPNSESFEMFLQSHGLEGDKYQGYRIVSRNEKLIYDLMPGIAGSGMEIYSPKEDLYMNLPYKNIDQIMLNRGVGFAIIMNGRMVFRIHL